MAPVDLNQVPEEDVEDVDDVGGEEDGESVDSEDYESTYETDEESEKETGNVVKKAESLDEQVKPVPTISVSSEELQRGREFGIATTMKRKREETEKREKTGLKGKNPAEASTPRTPDFSLEYAKARRGALTLPEGWLECPALGDPIGRLIPSKTPLGAAFMEAIEPGRRHSPELLVRNQKKKGREIGLVVDLTNTSRYYKENEWRNLEVRYVKIPCRGRNEVPENYTINQFCFEVGSFLGQAGNQNKYVLVHCTHGHNRTGFMIVNFMMRIEAAITGRSPRVIDKINEFTKARPPGIYKAEYIAQLFELFHERRPQDAVRCPATPEWKRKIDLNNEGDVGEDEEEGGPAPPPDPTLGILPSAEKMTNDDVLGDAIHEEHQVELQQLVYQLLQVQLPQSRYRKLNFPGSQPVSLDSKNLPLVRQRYYYATWKADGMRYMMLIMADGVYLIDRNFRFRRVHMRFPLKNSSVAPENYARCHNGTLLDGEMVIDLMPDPVDPTQKVQVRRYLVYDLISLHGKSMVQVPFKERWERIESEVVHPRQKEMAVLKIYDYGAEPFKIRRKGFWPLNTIQSLLKKMIPQLCHEADGLIFQGCDDQYIPRTHEGLLKWKYAHMNSVDFLLEKSQKDTLMLLLMDRNKNRLLEGAQVKFPEDVNPDELVGKIIECCYIGENVWEYMRTRHDKTHANAWTTYQKVLGSITDNITEDVLLPEIERICKLPMYQQRISATQAIQNRQRSDQHQQRHP